MSQKIVVGMFLFVTFIFAGVLVYELTHKLGGFTSNSPVTNWTWENNWASVAAPPVMKSETKEVKPIEEKVEPKQQLLANNYGEALVKSGETGKPILAFFTADWCTYCVSMKNGTMNDPRVKELLKNYILVYVDADKDRQGIRKFGVRSLPSYVITNYKEERLKFGSGAMQTEQFLQWLDNPALYEQPKSSQSPVQPEDRRVLPKLRVFNEVFRF